MFLEPQTKAEYEKDKSKRETSKLEVGKLFPRIINCHCRSIYHSCRNLKSINQAEAAYLNEINFFRLLIQKQDSLQTIKASILENNANAPFAYENCEYSEDALEVLKSSALMQQIPDKEFILKLLQAYKGCRKINEDNKDYYKYKQDHITRYLSHQTSNNIHKNYNSIYEVWAARLQEYDIKQLILTMPNTFNENPFTTPQKVIKETIELIRDIQ